MKGEKYRPSNGTEGEAFTSTYCMNCFHCDPNPEGEKQCEIMMRTFLYYTNDPEYPKEWIYDENNNPICTAWKKWDWGNDDDEGGRSEPPEPEPDDPNQLCLPFELNAIEFKESIPLYEQA